MYIADINKAELCGMTFEAFRGVFNDTAKAASVTRVSKIDSELENKWPCGRYCITFNCDNTPIKIDCRVIIDYNLSTHSGEIDYYNVSMIVPRKDWLVAKSTIDEVAKRLSVPLILSDMTNRHVIVSMPLLTTQINLAITLNNRYGGEFLWRIEI